MKNPFENIALRITNAESNFVEAVIEQFSVSKNDAEKVLSIFKKHKILKIDKIGGEYNLVHGAFWKKEVIQNAIDKFNEN